MLRITESTSADGAKSYYTKGLTREDYYSQGHEIVGLWQGHGARLLGLAGPVGEEAFFALCENRDPRSGETLTARQKEGRRVGYDFTFSAPKSVALLHALSGDRRILDAFRASVAETMRELEAEMKARVRKGGANTDRVTGKMVWAEFVHFTTRPVGGMPDPDLHAHCLAFNTTWDSAERRWKAGEFHDIKRDAGYYEAAFHARLAARMRALGYGVERHGKWWDVAGIPRPLIEKFSRRTAEIEAKAAELGITDIDAKGELGARTRKAKAKDLPKAEMLAEWRKRLTPAEQALLERISEGSAGSANFGERLSAGEAVAHAVSAAFERASVTDDKALREAALRRGIGSVLPEALTRAIHEAGVLSRSIDGRQLVTTREVLAEERAMLALARAGKGVCTPLGPRGYEPAEPLLNTAQRAAVRQVLGSTDRFLIVEGGAGTGKTTLMKEIKAGVEAAGRQIFAFAPTAEASRGVLRAEGFAEADTVARLLLDGKLQQRVRGQVWVIDEAGMLGTRPLRAILALATELQARVILSGDTRQHAGVERGDALRLLIEKGGLRAAEVRDIVRQRGEYREAVAALSRGEIAEGFARLDRLGWIEEMPETTRHARLAADYVAAVSSGQTALVVSPTHREADAVTAIIRETLKGQKIIDPIDGDLLALRNLAWTEADRADPARYAAGLVVQFFRDAPGIKRGERLIVEGVDAGRRVIARRVGGEAVVLPLQASARFQVYRPFTLGLAAGDQVRITQNGKTKDGAHKLHNSTLCTVKSFTPDGDLVLENGWMLAKDYGHLAHGYCTTSHASQGKTVDQVFIAQGAASLPATSREQFYVSVSRAREGVRIYTDDKARLLEAAERSGMRGSALELAEGALGARRMQPAAFERLQEARARARRYLTLARRHAEEARERIGDRWRGTMHRTALYPEEGRGHRDGNGPSMDR